jgi:glycosyltransferase involved in cell wall biosynthesis
MSSFRGKFEAGLRRRDIQVTHDPYEKCDALLIIAGTRHLRGILDARRRGVRIVQRLDGINWVHRKRSTGARHFLRAEYGNFLLSFIRSRIATHILYQSEFTRSWWNDWYGTPSKPASVVHNGVDLAEYAPAGPGNPPSERRRLLVVEGSLGGGYDMGLDNALQLSRILHEKYGFPMELHVVGRIQPSHQAQVESRSPAPILWAGAVAPERIPEIDRSAHLFFSADLNPACPNAVIEALACGLPVTAFDTGALPELVRGDAGRVVPYGGTLAPGRTRCPALAGLCRQPRDRALPASALHAEQALGLDQMLDAYPVLLEA